MPALQLHLLRRLPLNVSRVAALLGSLIFGCTLLASEQKLDLRTVEELPLDRFDDYPVGSFPPFPWQRLGEKVAGVTMTLEAEAESPFVRNKGTGKGLVLRDTSPDAGQGAGVCQTFLPPPDGDIYLGFDFRLDPPADQETKSSSEALALQVDLGNADDTTLQFTITGTALSLTGVHIAEGMDASYPLADLVPGEWYHLAAVVMQPDGQLRLDLNSGKHPKQAIRLPESRTNPVTSPLTRLSFSSKGAATCQGSWVIDNICMGGKVDAERQPWWPFDQLPITRLQQSKRKVFAYYFIYGSGHSTKDPGLSWYTTTVLNPTANKKADRKSAGTELLLRPFPRPPLDEGLSNDDARLLARAEEIRMARMVGFDGFLVDFWAFPHPKNGQAYFTKNSFALLDAAARIDPAFKIIPAVYSNATRSGIKGEADEGCDPIAYANSDIMTRILAHPSTMRMDDGRVALSMWLTERHSPDWWRQVMAELEKKGTPVALVCQFNSYGKIEDFSPIASGMAHWGPREPKPFNWVEATRTYTPTVIFPICQQDVRTRGCSLWECGGSETLTGLWQQAIDNGADWAFVNTWSDFSEQAMQPSSFIGYAPHDLNAYYTQWFKTGKQPEIVRDTLYYFYRRNHTDVDPDQGKKWSFRSQIETRNEIELLAFLEKPGKLRITVGDQIFEQEAPAGITRFTAPMPFGESVLPVFSLERKGKTIVERPGHFTILDQVEYPHMIYSSGVIAPERTPKRSWLWRLFN